ncbi:DUF3375 family protein [Micromonospora sp. NPDC051296]|uniref:DUF3375 family protein n=1 Tax=Micromonospora sp. NPDC051296 TaxID=3155046 RepID=UPI0034412E9A
MRRRGRRLRHRRTVNGRVPAVCARAYLGDWVDAGWLRRYYPPDSDEVHFDATPAVERALGARTSALLRVILVDEDRVPSRGAHVWRPSHRRPSPMDRSSSCGHHAR